MSITRLGQCIATIILFGLSGGMCGMMIEGDSMDITEIIVKLESITVGDLIGQGGFGIVRKANISGISVDFAIKLLKPSELVGKEDVSKFSERFIQEAEMLFSLRHPNIIPIFRIGIHKDGEEDIPYILMDHFKGENLNKNKDHSHEFALSIITQLAKALEHAHSKNIIHRDLKPSNILVSDSTAMLIDFGIAAFFDPNRERLTAIGDHFQTDAYASPEKRRNPSQIDASDDIYSLGALWFYILSGNPPFGIGPKSILEDRINIPPQYSELILRCIDEKSVRPKTMTDLLEQLQLCKLTTDPNGIIQRPDSSFSKDDIILIALIAEQCLFFDFSIRLDSLFENALVCLTKFQAGASLQSLLKKRFIEKTIIEPVYESDENEYPAIFLTENGKSWSIQHRSWLEQVLEENFKKVLIEEDYKESVSTTMASSLKNDLRSGSARATSIVTNSNSQTDQYGKVLVDLEAAVYMAIQFIDALLEDKGTREKLQLKHDFRQTTGAQYPKLSIIAYAAMKISSGQIKSQISRLMSTEKEIIAFFFSPTKKVAALQKLKEQLRVNISTLLEMISKMNDLP